jgi:hypothetical protein
MKLTAETVTAAKTHLRLPRFIEQVTLRQQGNSCPSTYVIVAELKLKWTSARILGASPIFSRHDKPPQAAKAQI